jgi:hypothetical protein
LSRVRFGRLGWTLKIARVSPRVTDGGSSRTSVITSLRTNTLCRQAIPNVNFAAPVGI